MKKSIHLFVMLSIFILVSCAHKPAPMTLVTENYPPLTYMEGDVVTGYGTEVVKAMQSELNSCDPIAMLPWDAAYEKAINDSNVVIFTMERTPARENLFNWIGPLGSNKSSFYVRKDSNLTIKSLEDAKKLKAIATTAGWFTEQYLKKQNFPNLISSEKPTDNVKQIMDGSADAAIFTDVTVKDIIKQAGCQPEDLIPIFEVMTTDYYIGISRKTDPEIVGKWDKAFESIKANGTLDALKQKWLK